MLRVLSQVLIIYFHLQASATSVSQINFWEVVAQDGQVFRLQIEKQKSDSIYSIRYLRGNRLLDGKAVPKPKWEQWRSTFTQMSRLPAGNCAHPIQFQVRLAGKKVQNKSTCLNQITPSERSELKNWLYEMNGYLNGE